jgi:hypothetical protein
MTNLNFAFGCWFMKRIAPISAKVTPPKKYNRIFFFSFLEFCCCWKSSPSLSGYKLSPGIKFITNCKSPEKILTFVSDILEALFLDEELYEPNTERFKTGQNI